MTLRPLHALLEGFVPDPPAADLCVSGLALDSRAVKPGHAFVALPGLREHGIQFAGQAAQQGASVVLYQNPLPEAFTAQSLPLPGIAVADLGRHLGEIAARFHDQPAAAMRVIGVTGTNGKTSTVNLLAQCLQRRDSAVGVIGTLGYGLHGNLQTAGYTTPDAIALQQIFADLRDAGAQTVAMEVSSHALDQHRVGGLHFDIAVFTNLSRDHLDYHRDMDSYAAAKQALFQWPGLAQALINIDDPWGRRFAATVASTTTVLQYGLSADAALRAEQVEIPHDGLRFVCRHDALTLNIETRLIGRFNVSNLLAVIGCLRLLGWDADGIEQACRELQPVPGRMNRLGGNGDAPLVIVDYAHTPDALQQALQALRAHTPGQLHCIFGCGGERDSGKRAQMAKAAEAHADRIVVTDDNPRSEPGEIIVDDILSGFVDRSQVIVQRNRSRAIAETIAAAASGDTVLIAGKGHECWQEINGARHAFDDSEQAQRALKARALPC